MRKNPSDPSLTYYNEVACPINAMLTHAYCDDPVTGCSRMLITQTIANRYCEAGSRSRPAQWTRVPWLV
jgi:hypothetical protein